jgi:predicted peptidase
VKDSTDAPFTVLLPRDYSPDLSYPALVVLHGAVGMQAGFPPYPDSIVTGYYNRHFTKYATAQSMIVVYPSANSQYNWMYPDDGFVMVPSIVTYLKRFLNIDDNRIYLTGHSNGATGAFSYLMKAPNLFAAFTGMNTQPKVRTGGTFLLNALNRKLLCNCYR